MNYNIILDHIRKECTRFDSLLGFIELHNNVENLSFQEGVVSFITSECI